MAFGNRLGQRVEPESSPLVDNPRGKAQKPGVKTGVIIGAVGLVLLGLLLRGALADSRPQPVTLSRPAQSQTVAPPAGNAQVPGNTQGLPGYSGQAPGMQQGLSALYGFMSQIGGLVGGMMGGIGGMGGGMM